MIALLTKGVITYYVMTTLYRVAQDNWGKRVTHDIDLEERWQYTYPKVDQANYNAVRIEKTFYSEDQTSKAFFWSLTEELPPKDFVLPAIIGKMADGNTKYIDLSTGHKLVGGMTRAGKTNYLNTLLVSLMHFSHPKYLRLVLLDGKQASFKGLSKIATTAKGNDQITAKLDMVVAEMKRRYDNGLTNIKEHNKIMFGRGMPQHTYPHIVVVFDEFQEWVLANKDKEKNRTNGGKRDEEEIKRTDQLHRIASLGAACGIHLLLSTQQPYKDLIKGFVSGNMVYRLSFAMQNIEHARMVLGTKNTSDDPCPTKIRSAGDFLLLDWNERLPGRAFRCSERHLATVATNLLDKGYDFRL